MRLSPVAEDILRERYYLPGEDWEKLCARVAKAVAGAEKPGNRTEWAKRFFELMYNLDFLPNSPTLMNAGTPLGQLSACFVLPIRDSMEGIFTTLKHMALIHKSGGGTGFNFSPLRPEGSPVRSTNGVASGVVSFMKVFNAATDVIKQGGKRRGANMGILDFPHPELRKFVTAKDDGKELQNFNISVMISDEDMESPSSREDLELIVHQAWKNGEPGLLFYDSINRDNVLPHWGDIRATNPCIAEGSLVLTPDGLVRIEDWERSWFTGVKRCIRLVLSNGMTLELTPEHQVMTTEGFKPAKDCLGERVVTPTTPREVVKIEDAGYKPVYDFKMTEEQPWAFINGIAVHNCSEVPMHPYESCNLGSINLANMVDEWGELDYDKFKYTISVAVRFLDNVISVNKFPLPQIKVATLATRRIGLGVMGFHDMLLLMGVKYSSKDVFGVIDYVGSVLNDVAVWESERLAEERGVFPAWEDSLWDTDFELRVRNATVTSIAPTGTLSRIAGVSSGIEPNFAYSQEFHILGKRFRWEHPLKKVVDEELLETTHDISPMQHLRVLAAWQEYIQNGVSKTVNLPSHATERDVEEIFVKAWDWGCKGITVYRDGSREGQPVRKCEDAESCTL